MARRLLHSESSHGSSAEVVPGSISIRWPAQIWPLQGTAVWEQVLAMRELEWPWRRAFFLQRYQHHTRKKKQRPEGRCVFDAS
ncbi:hypothetical protein [Xanthomonas cannabis]|uniref:hypothetical protein n=1 Tax=Xanthomonas cannabis TaxID=1885674 RepID=UPI00141B8C8A|nr:hypothetical protein [Xanthomonas cannabis]NIK16949.1 hypothetical protein [Xanthomonas cannabis]